MAWQVKAFAFKPDNLSSIRETRRLEGEPTTASCSPGFHLHTVAPDRPWPCVNIYTEISLQVACWGSSRLSLMPAFREAGRYRVRGQPSLHNESETTSQNQSISE